MKSLIKIISSLILLSLAGINLNAQSPQKMSFQAVIRNASNAIVSLGPIGMRISVVQGSATGQAVYVETQNATTNTNGLVSLQIGAGQIVSGTFSLIDWANGSYFIKTETDPNGGNDYSIIGSSELLSVPYALFAANVNINDFLGTSSDQISLSLLKIGQVLNINMTKGVSFGTNGHIIVTSADENHFEGTFNSYKATTGILVITVSEIIGAITHNYWTVRVNDSRGYNGKDGVDGIAGTRGLTGLTGLAGTDGTRGLTGLTGLAGTDGLNGTDGTRGLTGLTGLAGTDGLNGTDGTRGLTGLTGLAGADGLNGTIGVDGINGIDGLQGIAGAKGDIGETGAAGLNAVNGEPLITGGTISQYFRGDKTWQTLNATVVGLEEVNNTSDIDKPISTEMQNALNLKSTINSPTFTGIPLAPTAFVGNNTQQIATTAFVIANTDKYYSISAGDEIFTTSTTDAIATGLSFSPPAGKYFINFNSQYTIEPADRTGQAQIDLTAAYANLMERTVTNSTHGVGYGAGETLNPGVYRTAGAVTTTGNLTLDAGGDPNAEFIFQFGAALSTGAGFKIILTNGASACNVYWIAEGAIALGAATEMKGMLISNSGAVSLGSTSNVQGSLFSSGGAIGIDASTVSKIPGCANNFGSINSFVIFSKTGNISNAGASSITGDIASNTGTVTGFGTATINGSIYTSGISNATATFSIYQNGTLVPFSSRIRNSDFNSGEINLQALSTVSTGGQVEVRWNVDAGKVKLQNRIFTIQSVR